MEAASTPRVTCAYLDSYVGKVVMIVGKVLQLRGEEAVIDADGNVTAHLNRVSFFNFIPSPPFLFSLLRTPCLPRTATVHLSYLSFHLPISHQMDQSICLNLGIWEAGVVGHRTAVVEG